ncbi:MAG: hypothetical protein Q8L27_01255 [archaeon]|nr:hypothetical protein [archaeon]
MEQQNQSNPKKWGNNQQKPKQNQNSSNQPRPQKQFHRPNQNPQQNNNPNKFKQNNQQNQPKPQNNQQKQIQNQSKPQYQQRYYLSNIPTKTIVAQAIENVHKKVQLQPKINLPINQLKQQPQFRPQQTFSSNIQAPKLTITLKPTQQFHRPNQNQQQNNNPNKFKQNNQQNQPKPQNNQQKQFQKQPQSRKPESAVSIREEIRRMIREELAKQRR